MSGNDGAPDGPPLRDREISGRPIRRSPLWWILMLRGGFAFLLAAAVLLSEGNRRMLANFIGVYWLLSAVLTIRWALTVRWERGSRLGLVAGAFGVIAASLILLRRPLEHVISFGTLAVMLGVAAVLTGSLRLLGAFEVERRTGRRWTFGGLALGSVEVLLGVLLFFAREGDLRVITIVVAIWGFVGGSLLLIEGIELRRIARVGDLGDAG